jgi:hypothetical protein
LVEKPLALARVAIEAKDLSAATGRLAPERLFWEES